ncbi:MAG: helix-hairpin-helix domain-containing protein [candidate division WOR-3 bacterium]
MKQYMTDRVFFVLSLVILLFSMFIYLFNQKVENREIEFLQLQTNDFKTNSEKYELNSVTFNDLLKVPGIGEKTAQKIIRMRDSLNGFKKIEELLYIDGIKTKRLEKLKEYLYVDENR